VITGTFLACDFLPPPAPEATVAKLGCRIAENATGAKHDMSQHPEYAWGYEALENSITVGVTPAASPDDPWHVYYDIISRFDTLDSAQDRLKVGLKLKEDSATYYQTVSSVTGRLGLLLNGTWTASCAPQNSGGGYIKKTATFSNGNSLVFAADYSADATCASTQYTSESTLSLIKVIYNGAGFAVDAKYLSVKITPLDAESVATFQQKYPNLTFQKNVATEVIASIIFPDRENRIDYTSLKLEDKLKPQKLTWAEVSGFRTGESAGQRKTNFSSGEVFLRQ
jgi:hypothetical protein